MRGDARARGAAKAAAAEEKVTLEVLRGASFVPFGSEVMLTYPGTRKPVRVLNAYAEPRTIPIEIPPGYVLVGNDVLATDSRWNLVLRVKEDLTKAAAAGVDKSEPKMRLYEVESSHGNLLQELIPDKPRGGGYEVRAQLQTERNLLRRVAGFEGERDVGRTDADGSKTIGGGDGSSLGVQEFRVIDSGFRCLRV